MPATRRCTECQASLMPDWPEALCPKCLRKQAENKGAADAEPSSQWHERAPAVDEIADHFPLLEISQLIGQGGMGWVYKARQPGLDRLVSLKILSPKLSHDRTFAERFIREAKAMARLSHPNIISVYDFGISAGCFYFVMEYVDGVDLRQLKETKKITAEETLHIISKICDALQYAHEEGVVHRDIKPGNILIDKKHRVKVADFGLAKLLGTRRRDYALTQSNQAMGTPHYMAPEQTEHPTEVSHLADIYSVGVVFYELLTNELPIGRFDPPSHKAEIDPRLDDVVMQMLEKDPQKRFQTAAEVKSRLDAIIHTPAAVSAPEPEPAAVEAAPPTAAPVVPPKRLGPWIAPAVSLGAMLLLWWSFESRMKVHEAALKELTTTVRKNNTVAAAPAPAPSEPPKTVAVIPVPAAAAVPAEEPMIEEPPPDPNSPIVFADDFELGHARRWRTQPSTDWKRLAISQERNRTNGGKHSAMVESSVSKMERPLGRTLTAVRATFWIYTEAQCRAYGELVGHSGEAVRNVVSIGRHYPPIQDTKWNQPAQPDSYHARIVTASTSAWLNLDAHGSPDFSPGWHKFQIEVRPDDKTVSFFVDNILAKQVSDITGLAFDMVRIGSVGTATASFPAWFDDVKVRTIKPSSAGSPDDADMEPVPAKPAAPVTGLSAAPVSGYTVVFSDDFESGLGQWKAPTTGAEVTISGEQNHTPAGTNSALVDRSADKAFHNLSQDITGPAKATFWLCPGSESRLYGQIRCRGGQIYSIGQFHSAFPPGRGTLQNETRDDNYFQGRIEVGADAGWFNLNAPGAPAFSDGWHKFEIERLADNTIRFSVDGVLGRELKDTDENPWSQVEIGSVGSGAMPGTGWFDDVSIEIPKPASP